MVSTKALDVTLKVLLLTCLSLYCVSAQTRGTRRGGQDFIPTRQRDTSSTRQRSTTLGRGRMPVSNRNMMALRNRQISRARSFPARSSSRDIVQIDPRIINQQRVAFLRVRRRPQQSRPIQTTARRSSGNPSSATITTSDCRSPRSIRCYFWSRGRDTSNAFRCQGRCRGRDCVVPCECSCVHPRLIRPLMQMGRIRGPELRPLDNRLRERGRSDPNTNTPLAIRQALQRRLGGASQRGSQSDTRTNVADRNQILPTINFGISEDVLATLIAQPVLNEIVGPQGINQIIAGEPPQILSREAIMRGRNARNRQDLINRQSPRRRFTDENTGIPVPISQLNLFPDTRGRSSDIMSSSAEMSRLPSPNEATVTQLPGTNLRTTYLWSLDLTPTIRSSSG